MTAIDPDELHDLQDLFIEAARRASDRVLSIYHTDFDVARKADQTPVTEADLAAEQAILDHLAERKVSIPIISEESVAVGIIPEIDDCYILVDPLDGTREFVNRNGEFTVNIALVLEGEPILGVVIAPATGEAFWGAKAGGAFAAPVGDDVEDMRRAARPIRVADAGPGDWRAVASRSHLSADTEAFLARNPIGATVNYGSSLKLCRLAEGEADIYPRLSPTSQWDTAAGDAVLRAAGGTMIDLDGHTFRYLVPRRLRASGFLNGPFIACGGIDRSRIVV